jgi:hypothetical protein
MEEPMASAIVEVDEQGELRLPREVLGDLEPHTRFELEKQGDTIVLRPQKRLPFWATATPEERAAAFREWANRPRPPAPALPLEAIGRDTIYD